MLSITYTGHLMTVDPSKIDTDELRVPDCGQWTHSPVRTGDERPGDCTAILFHDAIDSGALIEPDGLGVHCYGDEDSDGSGFVLAAYPTGKYGVGITTGWNDVAAIALAADEEPDSATAIERCLRDLAGMVNSMLTLAAASAAGSVDERRVEAIKQRIQAGHTDADGRPMVLGARGTCTAEEVAEAQRRLRAEREETAR